MITKYIIKNEEILYLYMDYNYEFIKNLEDSTKQISIAKTIKNYIKNNNINFTGKCIVLIIAGIALLPISYRDISNNEIKYSTNIIEISDYIPTIENDDIKDVYDLNINTFVDIKDLSD